MIALARIFIGILIVVALLLAANEIFITPPLFTPAFDAPPALIGTWRDGDVLFTFLPSGWVAGRVGKGAIGNGRIMPNRSWFGNLVNWRTDYLVRGDLTGLPNVYRFTVALDVKGEALQGQLSLVGGGAGKPRALRLSKDR